MKIRGTEFLVSTSDILSELINQLRLNDIEYFQKAPFDSGNNIMVQCPYHGDGKEKKPSAGIRKSDGLLHCFACGETHTFEEMVSFVFGVNDPTGDWGFEWLKSRFEAVEEDRIVLIDFDKHESRNYVTEEELDSYRYTHPYLAKRGIVDENIIELFDLGYDKKAQSITFPVRDIQGNCLFVARRSVKTKFFNYPKGVEKPLYGLYELHHYMMSDANPLWALYQFHQGDAKDIMVCESMIDCILLWQAGHYAVALNGLGNDLQFNQLTKLPVSHIILATDNDEGGMKSRKRIKRFVKGKTFSEIVFPKGIKDIGECYPEEIREIKKWEKFL